MGFELSSWRIHSKSYLLQCKQDFIYDIINLLKEFRFTSSSVREEFCLKQSQSNQIHLMTTFITTLMIFSFRYSTFIHFTQLKY